MISYWIWAGWLLLLITSFSIFEGWNLYKGTPTLSASVWTWSKNFPLLPWIAGVLVGGLAVHFWWMGAPGLNCPGIN
jgi:hypothetical protein